MPSAKKLASLAPLLEAMYKAKTEDWGIKIKLFSPKAKLKASFYELRRLYLEDFESLQLLETSDPSVFLIFHQKEEPEDGEREDRMG